MDSKMDSKSVGDSVKKFYQLGLALDSESPKTTTAATKTLPSGALHKKYRLVLITLVSNNNDDAKVHSCERCFYSTKYRNLVYSKGYVSIKDAQVIKLQWLRDDVSYAERIRLGHENLVISDCPASTMAMGLDDECAYVVGKRVTSNRHSIYGAPPYGNCVGDPSNYDVLCHATIEECFGVEKDSLMVLVKKYQKRYKEKIQDLLRDREHIIKNWEDRRISAMRCENYEKKQAGLPAVVDHILPQNTEVVVWKAGVTVKTKEPVFIELLVKKETPRVTQSCKDPLHEQCRLMRKSRVAEAVVQSISVMDAQWKRDEQGNYVVDAKGQLTKDVKAMERTEAFGWYQSDFKYVVGQTVKPDAFDADPTICCGHGIHVHMHRLDAWVHLKIDELNEIDKKIKTGVFTNISI